MNYGECYETRCLRGIARGRPDDLNTCVEFSEGREVDMSTPRSPPLQLSNEQAELRLLRAHNDALQRQLVLKDQGISRLRHKVQERALMLSHDRAASSGALVNSKVAMLEAENARLRGDLSHRTSQLHSAVARIAALKERIDDLLRCGCSCVATSP